MSNELAQAVEDLKGFSKMFKAVIALADAVESAESVSELEATRRRNIAALDAKIAEKQDDISLLDAQNTEATKRFEQAKIEVAENVALNAAEAQRIIAEASAKADAILADANAKVVALEGKLASLQGDCTTLALEKGKLEKEYVEADGKLKAIKDEMRSIAG